MELTKSASFCVDYPDKPIEVQTDSLGRRVLDNTYPKSIYAFGESQLLGFDSSEDHHLTRLFPEASLIIAAAPNNGPFEALSSLELYEKRIGENLLIGFNLSTDPFRLRAGWQPSKKSPFTPSLLPKVTASPTFMEVVLIWDSLFGNSVGRVSNDSQLELRQLFKEYFDSGRWEPDLLAYVAQLELTLRDLPIVETYFLIYPAYWAGDGESHGKMLARYEEKLVDLLSQKLQHVTLIRASPIDSTGAGLANDQRHWRQSNLKFSLLN